eukprot:3355784-Alexandrium_andersonii.AAC.1
MRTALRWSRSMLGPSAQSEREDGDCEVQLLLEQAIAGRAPAYFEWSPSATSWACTKGPQL